MHSLLFFIFLATYYTYIISIFMSNHTEKEKLKDNKKVENINLPFFMEEFPAWWSWMELIFAISTILLIVVEIYQMWKSGFKYYIKDTENWIQIFVFLTAGFSIVTRPWILDTTEKGDTVRGVISLGVGAAWFEFILVIGRYPFKGGDFSIMFYRVLRKLFRYVFALFMIVGGFSCSFIVITYGTGTLGFNAPLKSFVLTLTMAMGEFQSGDLYNNFHKKEDEDEKISRTFAMILLVALILAGTITMVNLFITVIITDKDRLRQSVFEENLFYMAQCSEIIKDFAVRMNCCKDFKIASEKYYCVHKICGPRCTSEKVTDNIQSIQQKLRELAEREKTPRGNLKRNVHFISGIQMNMNV